MQGKAQLVIPMTNKCMESVNVVWPEDSTVDKINENTRDQVKRKIEELRETVSQSVTATATVTDKTLEAVMAYIDGLHMLHWSEVL